ncbi:YcdB/YcdC domain-containing protein [Oceanobacillus senegalensis]|uniref:YcdB/YcdC domain-containing protein n=1 Tax=Oceanobacillus senegalensis TaxID=1936063 RepID=UPI000A30A9B7|nr:YcdB/YcdC domain-containing protein [Oceanobacillus senegalensis]
MRNWKKIGTLSLATILSSGMLVTGVSAETSWKELHERKAPVKALQEEEAGPKIQIQGVDSTILKSDLVERVEELFPDGLGYSLKDSDFHMNRVLHPGDDTTRYELMFSKEIDGEHVYGDFGFVGEDLQLERFHHQPANVDGATFPPEVTKDEAEQIALDFLKDFSGDETYQLNEDFFSYVGNQTLLEPIRYSFDFIRTNKDVPVSGQNVHVTVLGNGQVVDYYHRSPKSKSFTYDDITNIQEEKEVLEKVKNNLSVGLQYQIDYNYRTGDREVNLVYSPSNGGQGVHAVSGDWQTPDGWKEKLPEEKGLQSIIDEPLEPKHKDISMKEVRAFAEEFLAVDSDDVTLMIESISEIENPNGQQVYSIHYMYQHQHGGMGTNLEIDKETGEIVQYHDMRRELPGLSGEKNEKDNISKDEALDRAVNYLKQLTPSHIDNYAMPRNGTFFEEERGVYHFTFPRVVNDIPVIGDQISVGVAADGSLQFLNVNAQDVKEWPSVEEVVSKEDALQSFKKALSVDLHYVQADSEKENHYSLVYQPVFNENEFSFLDASTGEWITMQDEANDVPTVSHPTAEKELNFLLYAGILDVKDVDAFDADAKISQGDALKVIAKSIRPFYDGHYPGMEEQRQSFENIDVNHPYYPFIEQAVSMGILDTESKNFDIDKKLTKEELAVWYIRGIGLEQAAELSGIYQLDVEDEDKVSEENIGYVALANALGLLTAEDNHFNPDQHITYAQLAVSIFKFAEASRETGAIPY